MTLFLDFSVFNMSAGRALINARDLLASLPIEQGESVADFGCGRTGHLVFPASWVVGEHGIVYAVDINQDALSALHGHAPHARATNVTPVWGNMEMLGGTGLPDRSQDHVFCVNNFWCVSDYETLFAEMARVLKRSGSGYLIDWKKEARHPASPNMHDRAALRDVRRVLSDLHIQNDPFYVSPHHWGLALKFF